MNENLPPCRLCGSSDRPLRESHIIPKFVVRKLFDEDKNFLQVRESGGLLDVHKSQRQRDRVKEDGFLCSRCEGDFNEYETYAATLIYAPLIQNPTRQIAFEPITCRAIETGETLHGWKFSNIDFRKFKLFLLSILWRFSASSLPFCGGFRLGIHENRVGSLLLGGNVKASDYPCALFVPWYNDKPFDNMVAVQPWSLHGHRGCEIFLDLFMLRFFISKQKIPRIYQDMFLNGQGEMWVLKRDASQIRYIKELASAKWRGSG